MGTKTLRLACIILLASVFPGAARRDTFKQEMRFGAEAAQRGLWREAAFRWEKVLKNDPDNARAHNNLAVAYEMRERFGRELTDLELFRKAERGELGTALELLARESPYKVYRARD